MKDQAGNVLTTDTEKTGDPIIAPEVLKEVVTEEAIIDVRIQDGMTLEAGALKELTEEKSPEGMILEKEILIEMSIDVKSPEEVDSTIETLIETIDEKSPEETDIPETVINLEAL